MSDWCRIERTHYSISAFGHVRNDLTGRILKPSIDRFGYHRVRVDTRYGKQTLVHRLVAEHFIGQIANDREVNHIDGVKSNNQATNLEIVSRKENIQHSVVTGLHPHGIKNGRSKLNDDVVWIIRKLHTRGWGIRAIGRVFSVHHMTIRCVLIGRTWSHV